MLVSVTPAHAADGQILITHTKALAGNVTPGDAAGYPVRLSRPGIYVLGSNLSPGPGLDGIDAASADITIDLNGFTISGGPAGGTNNARYGIYDRGDRLTVKNGTIGAFTGTGGSGGAAIYAPYRPYLIVENMRIINNRLGIYVYNGRPFARIQNNTIATNSSNGVTCGQSCHVEGNVVSNNLSAGIYIYTGIVLGNAIFNNQSFGVVWPGVAGYIVGLGNNTIVSNNGGNVQLSGWALTELHPNECFPVAC